MENFKQLPNEGRNMQTYASYVVGYTELNEETKARDYFTNKMGSYFNGPFLVNKKGLYYKCGVKSKIETFIGDKRVPPSIVDSKLAKHIRLFARIRGLCSRVHRRLLRRPIPRLPARFGLSERTLHSVLEHADRQQSVPDIQAAHASDRDLEHHWVDVPR